MIITNRTIRTILFACPILIALAFANPVQAQTHHTVVITNNTGKNATDFHLVETYAPHGNLIITSITGNPLQVGGGLKDQWKPFVPGTDMFPEDPYEEFDVEDTASNPDTDNVANGKGLYLVIYYTGSGPFDFKYWWTGGDPDILGNYPVISKVMGGSYDDTNNTFNLDTTPEPSEISVLLIGAGALGLLIRRRKLVARSTVRTSAGA